MSYLPSNVIAFPQSSLHKPRQADRPTRCAALIDAFAHQRRAEGDVFWLKENAELLNILQCTGQTLPEGALAPHDALYDRIADRLSFFPQYYRFFLSLCLDLEDLGMGGDTGAELVQRAAEQGLAEAELSDLQRAEARRLMLRRGVDPIADSDGLTDRLIAFASRSATFAVPNKKAAYELTHICFYLSEYGSRNPRFPLGVQKSLNFAGTLAYLDRNADLLAEVCVALRHCGLTPAPTWEDWLAQETDGFALEGAGQQAAGSGGSHWNGGHFMGQDGYHDYLVSNWALALADGDPFGHDVPDGMVRFTPPQRESGPLLAMSRLLMADDRRSADWEVMRSPIAEALHDGAPEDLDHLARAEEACADFPAFFESFARANPRPGAAQVTGPRAVPV
ncbi:hypothetical protein [Pseudooceanicola sp. HF7]|uniref:DUF6902 family protein n=1 Tax=Pseudooceanicola sp. HF7 TaxID=2721560 RepID=UPI0020CA64AC|nr:hypothetical protein [Pseudooceanicola sp. HF7]